MIAITRLILIGIYIFSSSAVVLLVCLLRPNNIKNVKFVAQIYSKISWLLGVKITITGRENILDGSCVYVANHQSNYDLFILSAAVPPETVSIGKKSILFFPFVGLIYWLTGNIFIERDNKSQAVQTLQKIKVKMLRDNISIWLFPEGTRNYGQGLKPFKPGAFYLARKAQSPLIPVSVSNYYDNFNLNSMDNGEIIIKFLSPISRETITSQPIRGTLIPTYEQMNKEITELDKELGLSQNSV